MIDLFSKCNSGTSARARQAVIEGWYPYFQAIESGADTEVRINGKMVGNTPLMQIKWPVGRHRIELLAPDGTVRKSIIVVLISGGNAAYTFDFTK